MKLYNETRYTESYLVLNFVMHLGNGLRAQMPRSIRDSLMKHEYAGNERM